MGFNGSYDWRRSALGVQNARSFKCGNHVETLCTLHAFRQARSEDRDRRKVCQSILQRFDNLAVRGILSRQVKAERLRAAPRPNSIGKVKEFEDHDFILSDWKVLK